LLKRREGMELEVLREDLVFGVRTAGHAIAGKSSMPILSGILLRTLEGELELCATDLERAIRCRISAQVKAQGEAVLNGQVLEQLVTRLPDEDHVLLAAADGKVRLSCGPATFELLTLPADEFPQLALPEGEPLCHIDREAFIQAIQLTAFAAVKATETTRLALTGVNVVIGNGKIKLAATNGYRLAVREISVEGLAEGASHIILIDAQVMNNLMRVLGTIAAGEVALHLSNGQVHFTSGPVVFTSRLIQEEFPDFERVIPRENDLGLFLPREDFLATLRRLEITAAEESGAVTLRALTSSNTLEVSSASREKGMGTERVRLVKPAPRGIEIAFKAEYLVEALRRMESDQVVLWLSAPDRAGLLEPAGDIAPGDQGFIYVCMPVRLL
jgi:DNA polymerase-3 subunit beta